MKKIVLPVLAAVAFASPALANEARVEVRGGVAFGGDGVGGTVTEDTYGVAAGYDVDLGKQGFVGVEVSGDKVAAPNTEVLLGVTGRAGAKFDTGTRLFVAGGYSFQDCTDCDAFHAGAGIEQNIGSRAYGKLEYRHYFIRDNQPDANAIVVGVGMRF